MKRKFSVTGWALWSALGVVSLSGCGGGESSSTVANNTAAPAASTPAPAPAPSGPMGPPAESGPSSGPASGPPAGYSPGQGVPGSSEGSSEGLSGGGGPGIAMDMSQQNSSGGSSAGSPDDSDSSEGLVKPGMSYGGPGGPGGAPATGDMPNSGGLSPGDMAQYGGNSGPGKGNSGGDSAPGVGSAPALGAPPGGMLGGGTAPGGVPGSGGFPGSGGLSQPAEPVGPKKPAEDAPYMEKAKYAFSNGREPDAYKFALAHALSGEEDATAVLGEIQWVKDLASPASGLTFAVGVDLKAPSGLTDYKPIGSTDANGEGGMGSGRGMVPGGLGAPGFGSGGGAPAGKKDDPELFGKTTGEFGRAFVRMFEERFLEGKFGKLFTDVENAAGSANITAAAGGVGFPGGGDGASSSGEMGMMAPGGGGRLSAPGMGGGNAPGVAKKINSTGHRLTPGLAYIGSGSIGELKSKAAKDSFDFLVVFNVQVEQNKRTGKVSNDTRVQLVNIKSGKVIGSSKLLNNIEVQKKMEDGDGDGIDGALLVLFNKLDDLAVMSSMPTLKPENAQKRISDLANSKQVPTLRALSEVCLFHHLKLINDEEQTAAYELLLEGADGTALGTGSTEEKRAALDKLVPKL
jgi:hypothetical protein